MFNIQGYNDFKIAYIKRFDEMEKELNANKLPRTYAEALLEAGKLALEVEAKNKLLIEQKPKVDYYNEVLDSGDTFTTTQIAKEAEMSARQLNIILVQDGIQFKQSGQYQLKAKYQNKGYAKVRTHTYDRKDGSVGTKHTTTWTEKGREFILDLLLDI